MSMTDTDWTDFANLKPEGQVDYEYRPGLPPERNLVTAVRELRRTTTGSYSAAVLDLLGAPSDAQVAIRAVNGQAIAPASVAATGAVSGTTGTFSNSGAGIQEVGSFTAPSGSPYVSIGDTASNEGGYILWDDVGKTLQMQIHNGPTAIAISGGNVGIGTTAPPDRLSVGVPSVENALEPIITAASNTSVYGSTFTACGMYSVRDNPVSHGLVFKTYKLSTGLIEAMRISNSGNVGIGTTSPGEKLEVAGNIKADSFRSTPVTAKTILTATPAFLCKFGLGGGKFVSGTITAQGVSGGGDVSTYQYTFCIQLGQAAATQIARISHFNTGADLFAITLTVGAVGETAFLCTELTGTDVALAYSVTVNHMTSLSELTLL